MYSLVTDRQQHGGDELWHCLLNAPRPLAPDIRAPVADLREISNAATWSLSSCKSGFGIDQLRDFTNDTYWQSFTLHSALEDDNVDRQPSRSDGPQPHTISLTFSKRTLVAQVSIYVDFKQDESYTPSKIAVRTGTNFSDLQDVHVQEMSEPAGWIDIPLYASHGDANEGPVRTHLLQIAILANHQHGKDTHIRQLKVYAPRCHPGLDRDEAPFTADCFQAYTLLR